MKLRVCLPIFATLALAAAASAQTISVTPTVTATGFAQPSSFMVRYFANLSFADSYIDLTNDGSSQIFTGSSSTPNQNICANVYTFDANEEMVSCCTCPITANGLKSLSVKNDLVSNTLTPGVPLAVVVKLVATTPDITSNSHNVVTNSCDATSAPVATNSSYPYLSEGDNFFQVNALHAWATTPHLNTATGAYQLTETEFSSASLSGYELNHITSLCGFINGNGSGFGICKSCLVRGLGASQQ
jgi:hypothetical protein